MHHGYGAYIQYASSLLPDQTQKGKHLALWGLQTISADKKLLLSIFAVDTAHITSSASLPQHITFFLRLHTHSLRPHQTMAQVTKKSQQLNRNLLSAGIWQPCGSNAVYDSTHSPIVCSDAAI